MLQLIKITKDYSLSGNNKVNALKGIDLAFRKSEFVSILGPSGCGKTTLLNLIGGLDHASSGDLIINNLLTRNFSDADWDVYRNHRIGFIFQSYNLIPHQTVIGNVELSLAIAGLSKAERTRRAKEALDKVGLQGEYYKNPNQLSGGQSQRVAIARALVNNPEILLADEPTGALDTVTSQQIMDLIKEISQDKLVIMVTHNPSIAEKYSTRIIHLLDGLVIDDSNPYIIKDKVEPREVKSEEKAKMSFSTSFRLSFKNLISKRKRTILTSIAGSIGIIGVSAVLALSYGVQSYIKSMQDDMLSGNPITITQSGMDLSQVFAQAGRQQQIKALVENGFVNVNGVIANLASGINLTQSLRFNNDINEDYINYILAMDPSIYADIFLQYGLDMTNNFYTSFSSGGHTELTSLRGIKEKYSSVLKNSDYASFAPYMQALSDTFLEAPDNEEYLLSQYELLDGHIAKDKDELMIVVSDDTDLSDLLLGQLGFFGQEEFLNIVYKATPNEDKTPNPNYNPSLNREKFSYAELKNKTFKWFPNDTIFSKTSGPLSSINPFNYEIIGDDFALNDGLSLSITGILRPKHGVQFGSLESGFYYTKALTQYVNQSSLNSEIVAFLLTDLAITDDPNTPEEEKPLYNGTFTSTTITMGGSTVNSGVTFNYDFIDVNGVLHQNQTGFVGKSNQMSGFLSLLPGFPQISSSSELTLRHLGGETLPNSISIYPTDFNLKDQVTAYLDAWNEKEGTLTYTNLSGIEISLTKEARKNIIYTDSISLIIRLINNMINMIAIALISFTSLSLVVSSVMIGIITYVSVVERTKEIGVIRSLGGRKKDVSNLFNSETFMIGLTSGLFGIGVTYILSLIVNLIVHHFQSAITVIMLFPLNYALIMVSLSVFLSLISGLIPAKSAAKQDPVVALRTE